MYEDIIKDWFPDHVPTLEQHGPFEHLVFANPKSSSYRVEYTLKHGRTLLVTGDIGWAVHCFSGTCDLAWIASCNLGYVMGKLVATSDGDRDGRIWDEEKAKRSLTEYFLDRAEDYCEKKDWNVNDKSKAHAAKLLRAELEDKGLDPFQAVDSKERWWMYVMDGDFNKAFPGAEYTEMGDIGMTLHCRHHGHLAGLKLAMERLKIAKH